MRRLFICFLLFLMGCRSDHVNYQYENVQTPDRSEADSVLPILRIYRPGASLAIPRGDVHRFFHGVYDRTSVGHGWTLYLYENGAYHLSLTSSFTPFVRKGVWRFDRGLIKLDQKRSSSNCSRKMDRAFKAIIPYSLNGDLIMMDVTLLLKQEIRRLQVIHIENRSYNIEDARILDLHPRGPTGLNRRSYLDSAIE